MHNVAQERLTRKFHFQREGAGNSPCFCLRGYDFERGRRHADFPLALYLIKVKGYPPPAPEEAANPPPSGGKVFSSAIVEE
jgi:hypothetical protein